jgi:dTDP-4-amino-4,6-dideoxygalactose transaminase
MPVAQRVTERCLSLPVHQHLSESDVETVIAAVREVMKA